MAFPSGAASQAQRGTGWSDKQQTRRIELLTKLTPQHFADTTKLVDDDLETAATIDTERGFRFNGGLTDSARAESFLRAIINKTSRTVTYQLYVQVTYYGERRRFSTINFATAAGPESAPLRVIDRSVECPAGPVCYQIEDVTYGLPEPLVSEIAARRDEQPLKPWRFSLKGDNGVDWSDDMAPAEFAGLAARVDAYL